jgi:hypothetical protein
MDKMKDKIILSARSWIGTKFQYHGRIKKQDNINYGACDCVGLIIGVARELNLKTICGKLFHEYDDLTYKKSHNELQLKDYYDKYLIKVDNNDMQQGDVFLMKIDVNNQHTGFIAKQNDDFTMIHAYLQVRKVAEHQFNDYWFGIPIYLYRFIS